MVIHLDDQLVAALGELARKQGTTSEALAIRVLKERLLPTVALIEPRDEWERRLLSIGIASGVALSNEAVSSEGIYE